MAVRIRLARAGRKKRPFYRVIVANSEARRDGSFLDVVGTYDPLTEPATVSLDQDKIKDWMAKGATPTDTVASLIRRAARG
ncbi:MAG: 30S ribosomal protein S16 [Thermodesulfobacteriota bacterium]